MAMNIVAVTFVLVCAALVITEGQGSNYTGDVAPNAEVIKYWASKMGKLQMPGEMEGQVTTLTSQEAAGLEAIISHGGVLADEATCVHAGLLCGSHTSPLSHQIGVALSDWSWSDEDWYTSTSTTHQDDMHHEMLRYQRYDPRAHFHFFLESQMPAPGSSWPAFLFNHAWAVTQGRFLPRSLASALQHLPLSSLLHTLHIPLDSYWATAVAYTTRKCSHYFGSVGIEHRSCATSVEDMTDFLTSELGSQSLLHAEMSTVATVVNGSFVVLNQPELRNAGADDRSVVCHRMGDSPYQIQACHSIQATKVYSVQLRSTQDPTMLITNVITCHTNTSTFTPDHISFRLLGIKPGGGAVCHWTMPGTAAFFT